MKTSSKYREAQSEILSRLRADRTQLELSRGLGYKVNQVHKWEAGRAEVAWPDFVKFCALVDVDLFTVLDRALSILSKNRLESRAVVKHLTRGMVPARVAAKLGISRSTLSRWIDGAQSPSFTQVLQLIELGSFSVSTFLTALLPKGSPALRCVSSDQIAKELNYEYPFAAALLRVFELKEYLTASDPDNAWLAKRLGVNAEDTVAALRKLQEIGAVEKKGERFSSKEKRLRTMSSSGEVKAIIMYWLERTLELVRTMNRSDERNLAGYLVFSATDEMIAEVRAAYLEFYQRVSNIVDDPKNADPCDAVMLMGFQMSDVFQMPPKDSATTR